LCRFLVWLKKGKGQVVLFGLSPLFRASTQAAFKFKRKLLGDLCRCALRSLTRYFEVVTGSALMPGVIAAIQTFGDRIIFHPHLHFLVTEGGMDEAGIFREIPRIDGSRLAEIFAGEVLSFLVGRELLSPE